MHEWIVQKKDQGITLFDFLKHNLAGQISNKKIKQSIDGGACFIGKRRVTFAKHPISSGDRILIVDMKLPVKASIERERILFEDSSILVYNKPAMVACDAADLIAGFDRQGIHVRLVHRLDKGTSGVIILAKTAEAQRFFEEQFKNRAVKKRYVAIVDGALDEESGEIENRLDIVKRTKEAVYLDVVPGGDLFAHTSYIRKATIDTASLVILIPTTGRTHQLRVHMKSIGHPIIGDFQYGESFISPIKVGRHMLHALDISCMHPETGENISFSALLPEDMESVVRKLFGDTECIF